MLPGRSTVSKGGPLDYDIGEEQEAKWQQRGDSPLHTIDFILTINEFWLKCFFDFPSSGSAGFIQLLSLIMTTLIRFLFYQTNRHIPFLNEYNDCWPVHERSRETVAHCPRIVSTRQACNSAPSFSAFLVVCDQDEKPYIDQNKFLRGAIIVNWLHFCYTMIF